MAPDGHEPAQASRPSSTRWTMTDAGVRLLVLAVAVMIWLPRFQGPVDLRWDGGVYYILGTSLAQGTGYRLLNEPGEIEAVQYPPLLPALIAASQVTLGTNDPTTVGQWLRYAAFLVFLVYMFVVISFLRNYLSPRSTLVAALLCLFSFHVYFLSDLLFPEILFSLATLLFLLGSGREQGRLNSVWTYTAAISSYALRTVGVAAFAAWVLDSLIRRRFRQTMVRLVLVLLAVAAWQFYIASVESSDGYNRPSYAYQRAPYMFYNVSYARNVALRDPFVPEKGQLPVVRLLRRFARNALELPVYVGETLSIPRGYLVMWSDAVVGDRRAIASLVSWGVFLSLYAFGAVIVLGGFGLQLLRREWMVPLYAFIYMAALCMTPFRAQFLRYLMPIAPLLALSLVVSVTTIRDACRHSPGSSWARLGRRSAGILLALALLAELVCFATVYAYELRRVSYVDHNGQLVAYRLFYYTESYRGFDQSIDFVRRRAARTDVIAAGMPHWVYLRTGLKSVMPPFEHDAAKTQDLLDSVPVTYLLIGRDVVDSQRYTLPVVRQFSAGWKAIYVTPAGDWTVYQRVNR